MTELAMDTFDRLVSESMEMLKRGFGINYVESSFFEIVGLIDSSTAVRHEFLLRSKSLLGASDPGRIVEKSVPTELLELVAHELKMKELYAMAENRLNQKFSGDRKRASGDISLRLLAAFDSDWEDREFYRSYHW